MAASKLSDDEEGLETVKYLRECRRVADRINSNHPGSLGLHPIVYFYSPNGRHKIASFLAVTALILDFEKRRAFQRFTEVREAFETLLVKHDYLVQQIVRNYRSAVKSYPHIRDFYLLCIEKLLAGKNMDLTIQEIITDVRFKYLTHPSSDMLVISAPDFSKETKSEAFIRAALDGAPRCQICGGYMHCNAISIDHIVRKQDGGSGAVENAQLAHPFCNTGVKS